MRRRSRGARGRPEQARELRSNFEKGTSGGGRTKKKYLRRLRQLLEGRVGAQALPLPAQPLPLEVASLLPHAGGAQREQLLQREREVGVEGPLVGGVPRGSVGVDLGHAHRHVAGQPPDGLALERAGGAGLGVPGGQDELGSPVSGAGPRPTSCSSAAQSTCWTGAASRRRSR